MFAVHIPGQPVGKQRPRVLRTGRAYTPAKTVNYEAHIRECAKDAGLPVEPLDGPLALHLDIALTIPKSWSKRKRESAAQGGIVPTGKPDIDNIAKCLGDALNGVLWADDAQIVSLSATKRYGIAPGVSMRVERI